MTPDDGPPALTTFLCGWLRGAAGWLVTQPLDTMRVRIQAGAATARAAASAQAGPLFAGWAMPTALVGVWKGVIFGLSDRVLRELGERREDTQPQLLPSQTPPSQLPPPQLRPRTRRRRTAAPPCPA
jgi:hypothetical protein